MNIGIIGAGPMGTTLAAGLIRLGHQVRIANSRGPDSLSEVAAETGATPASIQDAASGAQLVILAIPTKAVPNLPQGLFEAAANDVIIVDIGNYHPELRDGRIDAIDEGTPDSEWIEQQIGRPVIKAFNNILAASLLDKGRPRESQRRIALPVAGDSPPAKQAVLSLVDDLGFDAIDGGMLVDSWRQQPGTPAYCRDLEAGDLRRALAAADRSRIAQYRAEREAEIKREIEAQSA
jgi:hypothetical protein